MRLSRLWLVVPFGVGSSLAAVVSCVGDEPAFPVADGGDATAPGGPAGPGASPPPACDTSRPFGNVVNVSELNGPTDDESARLSPDETLVYFSRRGGPKPDAGAFFVLFATRGELDASFGALTQLSLRQDPSGPSINAARSTLYYSADDTDGGPDLYAARVPFTGGNSTALSKINSNDWDFTPYVRPDNMELYFASNRLGSDDIYVAPRVNGELVAPTYITSINGKDSERTPVVTPDALELYFASDRAGSYDIYVARRATAADAFGSPRAVTELNTPANDQPDWISPDGCTLYFRSDRPEGKGGKDIWRASKPPFDPNGADGGSEAGSDAGSETDATGP